MTPGLIPRIDAAALFAGDAQAVSEVARGAVEVGFLTIYNTSISVDRIHAVLAAYREFFAQSTDKKARVDMSVTGFNRGWGRSQSEQVDPAVNPDYKEVFDFGFEADRSELSVHAPNLWPAQPADFRNVLEGYFRDARGLSLKLLGAIAGAIGEDAAWFSQAFTRPMALQRGNFYPPRPAWAGDKDFGIAAHTDYGCLTLLATDGVPGLEVLARDGDWISVNTEPGDFVVNFGEMLEMWSGGRIKATLHRVKGSADERLSVPLFFNPNPETNVAPLGSGRVIRAVDHLQRRFDETYVHLQETRAPIDA